MLFPGPRSARNPGITKEFLSRGILESRDGIAGSRDRLGRKGFQGSSPGAGTPSAIPGRSRPRPAWPWALPGVLEQPRLPGGCAKASEGLGSCRERGTPSVLVPCGGSGMGHAGHSPWSRGAERGALGAAAEPWSEASGGFPWAIPHGLRDTAAPEGASGPIPCQAARLHSSPDRGSWELPKVLPARLPGISLRAVWGQK